jgi:hypothetical protein
VMEFHSDVPMAGAVNESMSVDSFATGHRQSGARWRPRAVQLVQRLYAA